MPGAKRALYLLGLELQSREGSDTWVLGINPGFLQGQQVLFPNC